MKYTFGNYIKEFWYIASGQKERDFNKCYKRFGIRWILDAKHKIFRNPYYYGESLKNDKN